MDEQYHTIRAYERAANELEAQAQRMRDAAAIARGQIDRKKERQVLLREIRERMISTLSSGCDEATAVEKTARWLSMHPQWLRLGPDTVQAHWDSIKRHDKRVHKWRRNREILRLAWTMTNKQIASAPTVTGLNGGKPMHPNSISRIVRLHFREFHKTTG